MTKRRVTSLLLLTILTTFFSCEEKNNCSEQFLTELKNVKEDYKTLYNESSSIADKKAVINSLEIFLKNHRDVSCNEAAIAHTPTKDISHLLSDLKGEERQIEKHKLFMAKVIYGEDNRVDVSLSTNELFRKLSKSTAAMINKSNIGKDLKLSSKTLGESLNLCKGQRFIDQINPASCSGFLVGADIMVTAGHCIKNEVDCEKYKWVFDFDTNETQLKASQIFSCKKIIKRKLEGAGADYAVFTIDRKVVERKPLKFRSSGAIKQNQSIVVIGHPSGLPTKIADGAIVRDQSNPSFFVTNLDTFGGNSGSAVFNVDTGFVEGILVRGETDYISTSVDGKTCRKVNECKSNECRGEDVTKITAVDGLPKLAKPIQEVIIKSIYVGETDILKMGGELSFFGINYGAYILGGRKFLDICGLQVSTSEDKDIWLHQFIGNCSDQSSIDELYKKFELLIE